MRRSLVTIGAILATAPVHAEPSAPAQPTVLRVSAASLFRIADTAIARGNDMLARRTYRALMSDPSVDIQLEARFRLALLESRNGKLETAALLLREVVDRRPNAARPRLELAGVLDRLGNKDGAWRQVRAIQASGLPPAVARLVDRYSEALRAARPFGASFEFGFAPDSNINRATRSSTLGTVFGDFDIDKDSKAKSGTGVELRGQTYRRFGLGGRDASLLVRLSSSADLYKESAFNDIGVDLAAGPELMIGRNRVNVEAGVTQRWFGQKRFMRSARLGATVARPVGRRMQVRLSGSAALIDNQLNDLQDGKFYSGEVSVERALSATTGVAFTASATRQALRDPGYSTTGWRLGLLGWHDLGRMTFTAGAEFGRLHADDRLSLFPDKRADRYSRLSVGVTFRRLSFQGFAPVTRFVIERNKSSIAFYDYSRRRTEFGFVRAF
ncbi:MAG TPA: surface lipoprotein assembly modifier [Sphingomicrobium sp.]|jgi:hypothetical protein|nr:surface lipoprotein assembly modifier [Sphingomicrobium sp.]